MISGTIHGRLSRRWKFEATIVVGDHSFDSCYIISGSDKSLFQFIASSKLHSYFEEAIV
jgi:hypothetical protein